MSMDSYQPLYDGVRSRIHNGDVGAAVERAMSNMGIEHQASLIADLFRSTLYEYQRYSVLLRPSLYIDGNMWCALCGENLQDGVAGFGSTPAEALRAFDDAMIATLTEKKGPRMNDPMKASVLRGDALDGE